MTGHTRGTGVGGAWVPLHHEAFLELLFDESYFGGFWDMNLGRCWEILGKTFRGFWGDFVLFWE